MLPISLLSGPFQTTAAAFWARFYLPALFILWRKRQGRNDTACAPYFVGNGCQCGDERSNQFCYFSGKSPESIAAVYNWQMGSIAAAQWKNLALPAAGVLSGTVIFTVCSRYFDMMMMGDEDAAALGLSVKHFRSLMFGFCSIVVASLVSVTGIIGFVGLVVPHMARILSGTSTNRVIIPLSALGGGIYLIWADALARSLLALLNCPLVL